MSDKALPTPREFITKIKEWQLHASFDSLPTQQITFLLTSKNQKQLQYKETYYIDNLPQQIKENYFKEVYELYIYLEREHNQSIKIYDFVPEMKILRFAYRMAKKVFTLKLRMFLNGVEERDESLADVRQSQRYSTNPYRMTVIPSDRKQQVTNAIVKQEIKSPLQISEIKHSAPISYAKQQASRQTPHQPVEQIIESPIMRQTAQSLHYPNLEQGQKQQDPDLDYFYDVEQQQTPKLKVKFTEEEDIDYDQWINKIQDNGSDEIPSKMASHEVGDYFLDDEDSNPYDLHKKITKSDIYDMEDGDHLLDSQKKDNQQNEAVDFKEVVKENVQLRHQNNQLISRVAQLQLQNKQLKQQLEKQQHINQNIQKTNQMPSFPNFIGNSQSSSNISSSPNMSGPFSQGLIPFSQGSTPFSQNPNSIQSSNPMMGSSINPQFFQLIQQSLNKGDEWAQQYSITKRPYLESPFCKYLDFFRQRLNICYQQLTLKDFDENFFPYDWSQVKVVNLDGNMLKTQGFDKVISNLWPNVTEISAGWNVITDVRNLENLPNLTKIDLRANPLTDYTKNYLRIVMQTKNIQILY